MKRLLCSSLNYSLFQPPSLHLVGRRPAPRTPPFDHDEWVRERPEIMDEEREVEEDNNIIMRDIRVFSYLNFISLK